VPLRVEPVVRYRSRFDALLVSRDTNHLELDKWRHKPLAADLAQVSRRDDADLEDEGVNPRLERRRVVRVERDCWVHLKVQRGERPSSLTTLCEESLSRHYFLQWNDQTLQLIRVGCKWNKELINKEKERERGGGGGGGKKE
jgi:hypothetical protein